MKKLIAKITRLIKTVIKVCVLIFCVIKDGNIRRRKQWLRKIMTLLKILSFFLIL